WGTKLLSGAILVLAQAAVLAATAIAAGLPAAGSGLTALWLLGLPRICFIAYAWGVFGSALGKSGLGALAVGLAPPLFRWFLSISGLSDRQPALAVALIVSLTLSGLAIFLSGFFFTRSDWERWRQSRRGDEPRPAEPDEADPAPAPARGGYSW